MTFWGRLRFFPDDGVDFLTLAASIDAEVDDASPTTGDVGVAFVWQQMPGGGGAIAETMRLSASGNLGLGGSAEAASSVGNLHLFNGTVPSAGVANGVVLYSQDLAASAELRVIDEAGNISTLSPHNFSLIPSGRSEPMAWSFYSKRDGTEINVDMLRLARLVEQLSGEKLVYIR